MVADRFPGIGRANNVSRIRSRGRDGGRTSVSNASSRPVVFFQTKPSQVDVPIFEYLAAIGVDLRVIFRRLDQPRDPELLVSPNFGALTVGYSWSVRSARVPAGAHVVVEGWSRWWAWRVIAATKLTPGRSLGVRFDTIALGTTGRVTRRLARTRARLALFLADAWHPVGDQSHTFAQSECWWSRPTVVIPYAVKERLFDRDSSSELCSLHDKNLTALVVSKLSPREAVADVIRAMEGLDNWSLTVVGDGPDRRNLERLAISLDVRASFVGYVAYEELPVYYRRADLFIHPARVEPWGVSVQEAMLSGLAVLASDRVGSAAELLPKPAAEWCFTAGDSMELASLIIKMSEPELRKVHGRENWAAARKRCSRVAAEGIASFLSLA